MTIDVYPTVFEAYQDGDVLLFKVEAFDEHSANVKIDALVSAQDWPAVSAKIQECLLAISGKS